MTANQAARLAEYPYGRGDVGEDVGATRATFQSRIQSALEDAQEKALLRVKVVLEAENILDDAGNEPSAEYWRGVSYAIAVVSGFLKAP